MIFTNIPDKDLSDYMEVLFNVDKWNISMQPDLWSSNRIDGNIMYKIHRHSSRIIDETGLLIQQILYDNLQNKDKLFPYYYQIIKFDNSIKNVKNIENICQTFTFLNGKDVNKTVIVKPDESFTYEVDKETYALAIIWSNEINEKIPKWFIRPYYRLFI
jgi:hypothetical protein